MSINDLSFQEEYYYFVEKHFDSISNLDDIFNFPDFVTNDNVDFDLNLDELYIQLARHRKRAQLTLNLYNSYDEFNTCQILICPDPTADNFDEKIPQPEKTYLIKTICSFIKYYCLVQAFEKRNDRIRGEPHKLKDYNHKLNNNTFPLDNTGNRYVGTMPNYHTSMQPFSYHRFGTQLSSLDKWNCFRCTYINKKYSEVCEVCYSLPNINSFDEEKNAVKYASSSLTKNNTEDESVSKILATLYRNIRFKSKVLKSEVWQCKNCEMVNNSAFCEACLSPSPFNDKWKCENCNCLNKLDKKKCNLCQSINKNIITCIQCNKTKITADRTVCDKCFFSVKWRCLMCKNMNKEVNMFCLWCGSQCKTKNYYRKIKDNYIPCEFLITNQ